MTKVRWMVVLLSFFVRGIAPLTHSLRTIARSMSVFPEFCLLSRPGTHICTAPQTAPSAHALISALQPISFCSCMVRSRQNCLNGPMGTHDHGRFQSTHRQRRRCQAHRRYNRGPHTPSRNARGYAEGTLGGGREVAHAGWICASHKSCD